MTPLYLVSPRLLGCAVVLAMAAFGAQASSIRPAFSPDGSVRCFDAQPFTSWNVYFVADLHDDAAANGITGAEFRVTGFDPAWQTVVTPSPAASLTLGNPIDSVGANIAFPSCEAGVNGIVLLYTVQVIALAPIVPRTLEATYRSPPCDSCCQRFGRPLVTLCDSFFSTLCVPGGQAEIPCPPVGTATATWSGMKSLYR